MARQVIGIDISDRSVEIVALRSKRGEPVLTGVTRAEIPAGTIQRGVVEDVPRLSAVLTGALDDLLGPKRRTVDAAVCLPETVVYSKLFSLPTGLGHDHVGQALSLEARDTMPISFEDVTTDFVPVSRDAETQDIMFAAVQNDTVAKYLDALRSAGVQPRFIDMESMALARALLPKPETEPVLIADIGTRTTMLVVSELGGVRQSANIPFGGDMLNEALEQKLKVRMADAETIKRRAGFDLEIEDGRVVLILQRPMGMLIAEVHRTIDHYHRKTGRAVSRIILAGGQSLVPDIVEYVSSNIPAHEVVGPDPFAGVSFGEDVDAKNLKKEGILYATALGLALRDLDVRAGPGVDLMPRSTERSGVMGAVTSAFSGLGSLTSFIGRMAPRKKAQSKKTTKKSSAKKAPAKKKKKAEVVEEEAKVAAEAPETEEKVAPKKEEAPEPEKASEETAAAPEKPVEEPAPEPEKKKEAPEPEPEEPEVAAESQEEDATDTNGDVFGEGGEHEYGRGVGDLLGSVNSVEHTGPVHREEGEPEGESLPETGTGRISIESILKKKVDGEPRFDDEDEEEPMQDEEFDESMDDEDDGADAPPEKGRRGPVPFLIAVLIVIVLVALTGILMFVRKNGVPMPAFLSGLFGGAERVEEPAEQPDEPAEPQAPSAVSANFLTAVDPDVEASQPVLVTRAVETDVTLTDAFPATGEAQADDAVATGVITVVNETSTSYTFVATTRFQTADGVLFRMRETTPIPANGSVDVEVYADEAGAEYDIGPSSFIIPGLNESLRDDVYGRSDAPMTGGSGTVLAVSEADIELARASLLERLQDEAEQNFKVMVRENERLLPDLVTSRELTVEAPEPGTVGSSFDMTLELRFRTLLVPEDGVMALLDARLAEALPEGSDPSAYALGSVLYTVEAYDTTEERAEIRAEAPVR